MKRYNFEIYLDIGDGYTEITEHRAIKEIASASVTRESTDMYYRIQLGEITFQNIPGYNIYDLIDSVDYTTEMKIKIVYGSLEVEGYFAKIDCEFDDDKNGKIIKATPAIQDQYRRFLENYSTEIEITDNDWDYETAIARVTDNKLIIKEVWYATNPSGNFYGTKQLRDSQWDEINTPGEIDFRDFFYVGQSNEGEPNITLLSTAPYDAKDPDGVSIEALIEQQAAKRLTDTGEIVDFGYELCEVTVWRGSTWWSPFSTKKLFYVTCKFAIEEVFMETSDGTESGEKVEPEGDNWVAHSENPVFDARIGGVWGYYFSRTPFDGAHSDNWELQDVEYNAGDGGGTSFYWDYRRTTKIGYPVGDDEEGVTTINTVIDFKDMLTYMYRQLHPDLASKEVKSLFFWNDDEASFPFMAGLTGCNYVTATPNELNNIKCIHTYTFKTDISDDDSSEDSILSVSFESLLEDLQRLFPVKPYIDDDLNLWLEHSKYFELVKSSYDISTRKEIEMTKRFNFDTSDSFDEKTYKQINSGYVDFNNNTMKFAQIVSNNRNKDLSTEVTTEIFSTDLQYCIFNPNNLENGLVLVLAKDGEIVNDTGFISGTEQLNGALCLSQILNKYHRYEGVWNEGTINDIDVYFENVFRTKVSTENLKFGGIHPSLFYTTQIGVGLMDEETLDFVNETTEVKPRYRYNSSQESDQSYLLAYGDDEGDIYDFGNTDV